uniref:Uncharacterized protein n=1 Tax=Sinocyclocheilus rhinocerous TaxID=307959 RepID=A0A673LUP5_9TELE
MLQTVEKKKKILSLFTHPHQKLAKFLILQILMACISLFLLRILIVKKIHLLYLIRGGVLIYAVHCMILQHTKQVKINTFFFCLGPAPHCS